MQIFFKQPNLLFFIFPFIVPDIVLINSKNAGSDFLNN